jgi:sulfite dehydrogenase (quinone) subunit SoeC
MHPAFSVIFFTTASGAGYGLLTLLGLSALSGLLAPNRWLGAVSLGLALALITAGLLASTAHLGRPERAWRAFSQWRSSWLSREGVMSIITYVPALVFAFGWAIENRTDGYVRAAGAVAAICALATVFTTGMIYASLKPIPEWHSRFTTAGYLIFSVMTGAVLLNAALRLFGEDARPAAICAVLVIVIGWIWKSATWRHNDALTSPVTPNSATGLKDGTVRSIEWPHTQENYVLKEMGYRVARKHASKLRLVVHALAFALPLAGIAVALANGVVVAVAASIVAVLLQAAGMLVERWLFFAEARHLAGLYYGR